METLVRATSTFWGSHTLKNHRNCGRNCGHEWQVAITITGDESVDFHGYPVDELRFHGMLDDTCLELNGKDINKMVKPSVSSDVGLAHWFYERFALKYEVTEVEVWHDLRIRALLRAP